MLPKSRYCLYVPCPKCLWLRMHHPESAATFPDLAEHQLSIEGNIRDLIDPFRAGYYYNRAMGGSFSIKSVLPAMYPDDPSLDYHNL